MAEQKLQVTVATVLQQLEKDYGDPIYQMIRERKITYEVITRDKADRESDQHEENGPPVCKIKLSELRSHLNELVTFIN